MGRAVIGGLLAALAAGCAGKLEALDDPDRWPEGECVARFVIEHDDSPLAELRERGSTRDEFQERFPAAVIDPSTQASLASTTSFTLNGQPIVWMTEPLDAIVLDGAAFAPLRGVDVPRLPAGESRRVGRVTPQARDALGDRRVLELLLRAGVIRSYWHLGADLCLDEEQRADEAYRAHLQAVHQYVTQEQHEGRYAFEVEIDPEGVITVSAEF